MTLAVSVTEFCHSHSISRTTFYELVKRGEAPRFMKVGTRTLISAEAAAEWRRRMESRGIERAPGVVVESPTT